MSRPKSTHMRMLVAVVSMALVAAACGGGSSKKKTATAGDTTTSTTVQGATTTTVADTPTTATTTAGGVSSSTVTTAKSTSGTTARKTTVTTITKVTPNTQPALANVVATTSTTAAGAPEITPGGSIVMQVSADVNGFDPIAMTSASTATDGPRGMAIFDVLFYQDSTTYDLVAQTAQSMTSTDGKVWLLKVRPNIKFSDGTLYDAEAIRFNWARLQDPANAAPTKATASAMTEMKVLDAQTLQITLASVNGQFPRVIANAFPFIGSPAALRADPKGFNSNPVGAGPFLLKEYVRTDHSLLVRSPTYWNAPQPYLDQINVKVVGDDSQRLNSLLAGEAQATRVSRPQDVATAKGKGYGSAVAILNGGNDLILNNARFPFNDKRVRQAVQAAVDLDAYNVSVEGGAGVPARTLFQSTSALFQDIQLSKYDTAKAKTLFDAAAADCKCTIEFTITASVGKSSTAAEFMQGQFQRYSNVKVNVVQVTTPTLVSNAVNGTFDAQVWANLPIDPEPNLYISFHTGQSGNFNKYSNPQMDAALDAGRTSLDSNARIQAYKTVQQLLADDVPSFFYARVQQGFLSSPKLHDMKLFEDGTPLTDRLWLSR